MKNHDRFGLVIGFALLFSITVGCSSVQVPTPPEDFEPTCIQGTVWYRTPNDATPVRYPHARVSAWRHGTDQGLAETIADSGGNYCIEVPLGDSGVDLRVFGLLRLSGKGYMCKGSKENVDPGETSKRCGEDCLEIDILTECQEFQPRYHRQI